MPCAGGRHVQVPCRAAPEHRLSLQQELKKQGKLSAPLAAGLVANYTLSVRACGAWVLDRRVVLRRGPTAGAHGGRPMLVYKHLGCMPPQPENPAAPTALRFSARRL